MFKTMQIILIKSVRKLGRIGGIINVANGYGRNYLIPQRFAIRANKENLAKVASLEKELEAKNAEQRVNAEKVAKMIEGKNINFITQSVVDGRLFGSINAKALAIKVSKLSKTTLTYKNIILDNAIKFNGVYNIQIVLHPEVTTNVLVVVAKTEAEAQETLKEHKERFTKKNGTESKEADLILC